MRVPKYIVDEFVRSAGYSNGYGLFRNQIDAIKYAHGLTRSQIRKWRRYGIVPSEFREFCKKLRKLPALPNIEVIDVIRVGDGRVEPMAEYFERKRRLNEFPELKRSFGKSDGLWHHLESLAPPLKEDKTKPFNIQRRK